MQRWRIAFLASCAMLFACSTGQMTSYGPDGTRTVYSKYYDKGVWLEEGRLGLQLVVDHGAAPNPNVVVADGLVTIYLVNLEDRPREIQSLAVSTPRHEKLLRQDLRVVALKRSRTKVPMGTIPIFDYGTEIPLTVTFQIDGGPQQTLNVTLPRITDPQLKARDSGERPPYPWFEAPYFPFTPPLSIVN
jgi:hypothetical protein